MIVVIEENEEYRGRISEICRNVADFIEDSYAIASLSEILEKHSPNVIVFGPSVQIKDVIDAASNIAINNPEISIVMMVDKLNSDLLRDAMRAGVKDVIEHESSDEQVMTAISRALDISKRLTESLDLKSDAPDGQTQRSGQVLTFFSTKGGVGKSVISTNVAVALAKKTDKKIVILDLDLQFGDIAIMLQMTPEHTLYDAAQVIDRLDEDMLQGFLSIHPSGVKAMLAPVKPHEVDTITAAQIKAIIDLLRNFFDYIVIDTPPAFNDVVLTALDESDLIYLIATMDMPSIKNIKLAIQVLKQLGYPPEITKFILNRADSKVFLEIDEVEKSLDIKAEVKIPSDRLIPKCVNKGVPVVIEQPKSQVARSFFSLAEKIKSVAPRERAGQDDPNISQTVRRFIRRLS